MTIHKCRITVIDKKCYTDLQEQYLADPKSGPCPIFEVGQEFILERHNGRDDFWHMMDGKFCSEAWDAISRYVYAALQGGCNDGTRPVIFKIERIDEEIEE